MSQETWAGRLAPEHSLGVTSQGVGVNPRLLLEGGIRIVGRVSLAILALVVAGCLALGAGQASASHVNCGDTITTDTKLDSNLTNCPNNGIVIGTNGVTLNLNGHRIDGDGTPAVGCDPETEFCDVGVVNDGHDGVTVKQGSVREFLYGVFVGRARHNRVLGISSRKNFFFGFYVVASARSLVRNSSGSRNPAPEGDGLGLFGSHRVRIVHSSFRRNGLGIHVAFDSSDNLIKGNRISRNADFAIFVEADRNRIRRNRCVRNSACVLVAQGNANVIARNRVLRGESGLAVERGRANVIARNVIRRPRRTGIYLGLNNPPLGGSHNIVRRNRIGRSAGDAFTVREEDHHSRLWRNVATGSGDDGFDIASRSAKLTRNRAWRNADLGIEAVRGVIDGGGNIARHNGDPRQCKNIVCD
jgi:parallel beta-helix repeat protein